MRRTFFYFLLLSVLGFITSCSTLNSNRQKAEEEQIRNISTAKINVQLGIAYLERQNLQRAKRKLALAIQQAPTIPEPWYSMAYYYENIGEKETAKKYYLKAIALAPLRGDTNNNYGTFLCRQGQYRESIQQFMVAVKDEDYLDPASAYENAGLCASKIPDKKLAAEYLERAIKQDPNRPLSLYKLASLYYEQGNFSAARIKMAQFSAISPHTADTLELRSKIESKLFAQRQIDYMTSVSFNNFLKHEKQKLAKPVVLANKTALRKKFLKPAEVKIISLHQAQSTPKKKIVLAKHDTKKKFGQITSYEKLVLQNNKAHKKNQKSKYLQIKSKPKALAKAKPVRKNDKMLSKAKTNQAATKRQMLART